jgi:hypothetical protein
MAGIIGMMLRAPARKLPLGPGRLSDARLSGRGEDTVGLADITVLLGDEPVMWRVEHADPSRSIRKRLEKTSACRTDAGLTSPLFSWWG